MGSVVWEEFTLCSPHFLHAFPKCLLPDTFGDVGLIWADCSCFSDTFEQRAADAAAPLLEHCSTPETSSQTSVPTELLCYSGGCVGWGSLTLRHLGFLNTGGLLLASEWWDTPRTGMTKWSWSPSKAFWGGGTGGNCGDPEVCRSQAGSQPRAAADGQCQIGSRALSSVSHWNTACFVWVGNVSAFLCACGFHMIQACCFRRPVSLSPSPCSLWSWVHSHQLSPPAFCPHSGISDTFYGLFKIKPICQLLSPGRPVTASSQLNMKGVKKKAKASYTIMSDLIQTNVGFLSYWSAFHMQYFVV